MESTVTCLCHSLDRLGGRSRPYLLICHRRFSLPVTTPSHYLVVPIVTPDLPRGAHWTLEGASLLEGCPFHAACHRRT